MKQFYLNNQKNSNNYLAIIAKEILMNYHRILLSELYSE